MPGNCPCFLWRSSVPIRKKTVDPDMAIPCGDPNGALSPRQQRADPPAGIWARNRIFPQARIEIIPHLDSAKVPLVGVATFLVPTIHALRTLEAVVRQK